MTQEKVSIAWECQHCGKRAMWRFGNGLIARESTWLLCESNKCRKMSFGTLVQIGRNAYALSWK